MEGNRPPFNSERFLTEPGSCRAVENQSQMSQDYRDQGRLP